METLAVIVGLVVVVGGAARLLDTDRACYAEAARLRARISERLRSSEILGGLPVTAAVRVPLRQGSPVTVTLRGRVPSIQAWQAVLGLVERATLDLDPGRTVRIRDRLAVLPLAFRRAA